MSGPAYEHVESLSGSLTARGCVPSVAMLSVEVRGVAASERRLSNAGPAGRDPALKPTSQFRPLQACTDRLDGAGQCSSVGLPGACRPCACTLRFPVLVRWRPALIVPDLRTQYIVPASALHGDTWERSGPESIAGRLCSPGSQRPRGPCTP